MLSALSSYIWGSYEDTEEKPAQNVIDDQIELDNDWIFVRPKDQTDNKRRQVNFQDDAASTTSESSNATCGMEESWLVTPPQCFNSKRRRNRNAEASPMENLLIEHPSMSIYQDSEEIEEEQEEQNAVVVQRTEHHRAVAGRLQELAKRQPLKDLNVKSNKISSPKDMKRKNLVYIRRRNTRNNKQYGRQNGKHAGMVGKRAT